MADDRPRRKDSVRLVWDTKPRRAPNPRDIEFQTAEVVIPNPQTKGELPLSFRDGILGEQEIDKQKMNRLIWGDNLLAMQALLSQGYESTIDFIYADPPFDSKADYSHKTIFEGGEVTKEPSVIERLAYKDTWAGGTDSYLDMLYPRLRLMSRLLSPAGLICLHCDWHIGHYIRVLLDEIFGSQNFVNEVVWHYFGFKRKTAANFPRKHDTLLLYAGRKEHRWNVQYKPHRPEYVARFKADANGRLYRDDVNPTGGGTRVIYLDEVPGDIVDSVWDDIPPVNPVAKERVAYETQKPEALLERLIKATTSEGGLIADFFAGSGTAGVVAEKLSRRWLMCELGKVGIQVTRGRLVEQRANPFLIENIGNYQREMIYLTGGRIWEMQRLILRLYGATPRDKDSGLGTRKTETGVALVYVGYPDRPVTAKKAEELALLAHKLDGTGYDRLVILGWDYEYNYHQSLQSRLHALKERVMVQVESRDIPPDIYDYLKKAKTDDDIASLSDKIHFYERPYLRLDSLSVSEVPGSKIQVKLGIKRYVLMDIPLSRSTKKGQKDYEELMKRAKDNFAVLIDYWAVDWDYDGFTFKSQWQAFRGNGKKAKTVPTEAIEILKKRKKRTIAVRVVDIFGNDAAATIPVK